MALNQNIRIAFRDPLQKKYLLVLLQCTYQHISIYNVQYILDTFQYIQHIMILDTLRSLQINTYYVSIHVNTCQYMPIQTTIHTKTFLWVKTSVLNQNQIHALHANTYQCTPQYIPDIYQYVIGSAHRFWAPRICIGMYCGMYWFVLCKCWACIVK